MANAGTRTAFGEALRRALDGRKVPWLEAATGINRQRLHRLITGRGEVTLVEATAIASALSVPVETFLPPVAEEPAPAPQIDIPLPFASVCPHGEEATEMKTASAAW